MKPLKITLIGLVALLAITVAYGYGCGGGDDGNGGGTTSAAEADGTSTTTTSDGDQTGSGDETGGGDETGSGDETGGEDGAGDGDGGGDGADGGGGDGAPLSKAAYIKQGDAICQKVPKRYGETVAKLEEKGKKKASTAEVNLKAAVPPLYTAMEELEALSPPSGDEQRAEAIVDALEVAAKGLEAKPTSELTGPKSPFAEFQKLTKAYGFQTCSQL